ncbi:integrase domain-containing protein [Castellaniella caeni]|uniref:integrase domain-containing protein n=1 Tax=Castellaniella caeni TaxID=266123 RepID=UPI000834022A
MALTNNALNALKPRDKTYTVTDDRGYRLALPLPPEWQVREADAGQISRADAEERPPIAIKGSWARGGRDRTVPIATPEQRAVLDEAYRLAGLGSLIPSHKTYIQQRHVYDGQCKAAGLSNMHGLRHRYAQMRSEND